MSSINSGRMDEKYRWGGILEHPYISKLQRHILDGFKVTNLARILESFRFENILDVCCGMGEYSTMNKGRYVGLDNSESFIRFAAKRYQQATHRFVLSDATEICFKNNSFEAVLNAGSAHHFSDEQFSVILHEMKRVSYRYVIVADIVRTSGQNRLSRYLYHIDRGRNIRYQKDFEGIFKGFRELRITLRKTHVTFPGFYNHAVFVLELTN